MTTIIVKDGNGNLQSVPVMPIGQTTGSASMSVVLASDVVSSVVLGATANVAINNLPASQNVVFGSTANVAINNYPATQNVSFTNQSIVIKGTVGVDYSANKPSLPVVANTQWVSSGLYASWYLIKTVPANASRVNIEIQNTSGAQIAILRDDGTAANAAAPLNASVFSLSGGVGSGSQGGGWSSTTFRGRLQVYAASSAVFVSIMED